MGKVMNYTVREATRPVEAIEQQLGLLEGLLSKWGVQNVTRADTIAKRKAALAFLRKVRRQMRASDDKDSGSADEGSRSWVDEATNNSYDLEKEDSAVETDLAEPSPKSEEERGLERLEDILRSIDPANASQVADLATRLGMHRGSRASRWPNEMADLANRVAKRRAKRSPIRPTRRSASSWDNSNHDDRVRGWLDEVTKADDDFDRETGAEEADLGEPVPKSQEEKDLERIQSLIDAVDPANETEVEDLAAALARKRELGGRANMRRNDADTPSALGIKKVFKWNIFKRKPQKARRASASERVVVEAKAQDWRGRVEQDQTVFDEEIDSTEREIESHLDNLTAQQENVSFAADQELQILEEIWDRYLFENENATAMDVMDRLDDESNETASESAFNEKELESLQKLASMEEVVVEPYPGNDTDLASDFASEESGHGAQANETAPAPNATKSEFSEKLARISAKIAEREAAKKTQVVTPTEASEDGQARKLGLLQEESESYTPVIDGD